MNKYILIFLTVFILFSCTSQQQVIQTQRNTKPLATRKISTNKSHTAEKNPIQKSHPKVTAKVQSTKSNPETAANVPATEVIVSTSRTKVSLATIQNYILQYKDIAMNNMRTNGIPASIILAQAILESGAGNGDLARDANNHFGIKCHKEWAGESVRHDDDAAQECFRKYKHAAESFQDHATFLSSRGRYSALFKLPKSDYRSWARGLRAAGYATDPKYPEKLVTYIQKYNLDQYDNLVLGIQETRDTQETTPGTLPKIPIITDSFGKHEVQKGETFYSISKKYSLTVDELKQKNGLAQNALSVGQVLIIR